MPALVISSVNTGTDELTITSHGLNTGDGPAAIHVIAGGTLPSPLAAVTDYWFIKTGTNTGKLATSSANALLGIGIDITTTGSGTLTLEIGIPYRRARTYQAGVTQVKSLDLNAMMDALIAIYAFLTAQTQSVFSGYRRGSKVRHIPIISGIQTAGTAMGLAGVNTDNYDAVQTTATNNKYKIPIQVDEGERITAVSIRAHTLNAGDTASIKVLKTDATGSLNPPTSAQLGSTQTTSAPPSAVTLTVSGLTETVGSTLINYYVEITCSAFNAGTVFSGLTVTTDIP